MDAGDSEGVQEPPNVPPVSKDDRLANERRSRELLEQVRPILTRKPPDPAEELRLEHRSRAAWHAGCRAPTVEYSAFRGPYSRGEPWSVQVDDGVGGCEPLGRTAREVSVDDPSVAGDETIQKAVPLRGGGWRPRVAQ